MRRFIVVFGAVTAVVGAVWLHHARAVSTNCTPHTAGNPGFGVTANCLNQVGVEYVSFGVMMAGLFIIVIALVMMDRHRAKKHQPVHPERRLIGTPGEHRQVAAHVASSPGPSPEPAPEETETGPGEWPEDP